MLNQTVYNTATFYLNCIILQNMNSTLIYILYILVYKKISYCLSLKSFDRIICVVKRYYSVAPFYFCLFMTVSLILVNNY